MSNLIDTNITKSRITAWILLSLLPFAAIILGILLVIAHTIINVTYLLAYIVFPLLTILLLKVVIFSEKAIWIKVILSIVILPVFLFLFLATNFFGKMENLERYKNKAVAEHYFEIANDTDPMPSLSDIGNPKLLEYYKYFSLQAIYFDVDVNVLIGTYDQDEYTKQKALLEETYVFQEEPMTAFAHTCEPVTELNGYVFRTLSLDYNFYSEYPKNMKFIATNDNTREIVYISHSDDDIDYIISLDEFIKNECGWKHIR